MESKIKMDEYLLEFTKQHSDAMHAGLAPDFKRIEAHAIQGARRRKGKKARSMLLRTVASVVAAVVLMNCFLLFANTAPAKAYQDTLRQLYFNVVNGSSSTESNGGLVKTAKEITDIQKNVPFPIPTPTWLPDGYAFDHVKLTTSDVEDIYNISITYKKQDDAFQINITNDTTFADTKPSPNEPAREQVNILGMDVYLITGDSDGTEWSNAIYFDKNGLFITIGGVLDRQSLVKVIESMK